MIILGTSDVTRILVLCLSRGDAFCSISGSQQGASFLLGW